MHIYCAHIFYDTLSVHLFTLYCTNFVALSKFLYPYAIFLLCFIVIFSIAYPIIFLLFLYYKNLILYLYEIILFALMDTLLSIMLRESISLLDEYLSF